MRSRGQRKCHVDGFKDSFRQAGNQNHNSRDYFLDHDYYKSNPLTHMNQSQNYMCILCNCFKRRTKPSSKGL